MLLSGNLLYNRGPNAPGAEWGPGADPSYRFDKAVNRVGRGDKQQAMMQVRRQLNAGLNAR